MMACSQLKDDTVTTSLLTVAARCRANAACLFEGQDMFVDIAITNTHTSDIRFPLEYVRKNGPLVKLTDVRTKAETYLQRNLADPALLEKLTTIQPGASVEMEWVITSDELGRFGGADVDVFAEFTVAADVQTDGREVKFSGASTLRITSRKQ
jgi:hypothetical protein